MRLGSSKPGDGGDVPHFSSPLTFEIIKETSPELGIKIAYDFARNLRAEGAVPEQFRNILESMVEEPFAGTSILPYIRCGFAAGFYYSSLPWRRDIDDAGGEIDKLLYRR
jgi:hypothetical protein